MAEIQKKIVKQGKRHAVSRGLHSKRDKDAIAGWRQDLTRILQIFHVRLTERHLAIAEVSVSDGTVNQQQYDAHRYASEYVGRPGRYYRPKRTSEYDFPPIGDK